MMRTTDQGRTWEITAEDGSKRTVTLEQYRAELAARRALMQPISDAWRRGDMAGVERAQKAARAAL